MRRRNQLDEEEEEINERAMRKRLNKEFEAFVQAVQHIAPQQIHFDVPYRQLSFWGSPFRSNCLLSPTVNCLINITETPFFILILEEVELACFERMMSGLKNFDLVFVYKNYEKPVMRITAVPITHVEQIKNWLDKMDIIFFESTKNFAWVNILGEIKKDLKGFLEDGGWNVILGDSDSEGNDEEEQDQDSEFEVEGQAVFSVTHFLSQGGRVRRV